MKTLEVLKQTIAEEKQADELLTKIAESSGVNAASAKGDRVAHPQPQRGRSTL